VDATDTPRQQIAIGMLNDVQCGRLVSIIINADLAESSSTVTAAGNDPTGWKTAVTVLQVKFRNGSLLTRLQDHILQLNIR
jgi:hypothetical protein